MDNPFEAQAEIAHTADEFKLLSRKEAIRVQIKEAQDELESMRIRPDVTPDDIEPLEQYLRANMALLERLEQTEQDLSEEIENLKE